MNRGRRIGVTLDGLTRRRSVIIGVAIAFAAVGCELVANFDRSRIADGDVDADVDATATDAQATTDARPTTDAALVDASDPRIKVIVVDSFGLAVPGIRVEFEAGVVTTGGDGIAIAPVRGAQSVRITHPNPVPPDGGNVRDVPSVFVPSAEEGDLIHVGPISRSSYVRTQVMPPSDVDASTIASSYSDCVAQGSTDVALSGRVIRTFFDANDFLGCVHPGDQVGVTSVAYGADGTPLAFAYGKATSAADAGEAPILTIGSGDWVTPSLGQISFLNPLFDPVSWGVDFPFELGRYTGGGGGSSGVYVMPPASLAQVMIVRAMGVRHGGACPIDFDLAAHVRRLPATASIVEDENDFRFLSRGDSVKMDGVEVCPDGSVYPIAPHQYGVCDLGGVIITSPQLPYSLARQWPTALVDPYALLAQAIPSGDVDLQYSLYNFMGCAAPPRGAK